MGSIVMHSPALFPHPIESDNFSAVFRAKFWNSVGKTTFLFSITLFLSNT